VRPHVKKMKIPIPTRNSRERGNSTQPVMKVEEKSSRLLEKKNEEKDKNYADILKGRNHGQQESKRNECKRNVFQRRPSTSRYQRSFNHCEGNNRREDHDQEGMNSEGIHHKEDHSLPGIKASFMVIVLLVITLDIKL
jgi:hypothetical protein